jgi:hypothetical protein
LDEEDIAKLGTLQFRYRSVVYSGTIPEITEQLTNVKNSSRFQNIPQEKQKDLDFLLATVKQQSKSELYKEKALAFLTALYSYEDFLKAYDTILYEVIKSLKEDMQFIDFKLERSFVKTKIELDDLKKESPNNVKEIEELKKELDNRQKKLVGHRWMKKKFDTYTSIEAVKKPDSLIAEFKKHEAGNAFKLYEEEKNVTKINLYLEVQIIDFYYHKSLEEVNPDTFKLRYIDKI